MLNKIKNILNQAYNSLFFPKGWILSAIICFLLASIGRNDSYLILGFMFYGFYKIEKLEQRIRDTTITITGSDNKIEVTGFENEEIVENLNIKK